MNSISVIYIDFCDSYSDINILFGWPTFRIGALFGGGQCGRKGWMATSDCMRCCCGDVGVAIYSEAQIAT